MRRSSTIDALFPVVRQQVLAATLMNADRWWYLSDLAAHLRRSPSSLQRELARLAAADILETREEGNRTYYRPNRDAPLFHDLTALIAKTVGVADVLRGQLAPFASRIDWAFIYGSLARSEEVAESDVDVLLIADITLGELASSLKAAEQQVGRPVNVCIFPRREFVGKFQQGHHFVRTVAAREKLFLLGDAREFDKAFADKAAAPPSDSPKRDRRAAGRR